MLQTNKPRADNGEADFYGRTEPQETSPAASIETLFDIARRQYTTIALVTVLTITLGWLYLYLKPVTFQAEARLLIDRGKVLEQRQPLFVDSPVDSSSVESEIEILKSDNIALAVIKKLHLVENGEFSGSSGIVAWLRSFVSSVGAFLNPHPPSEPGSETDKAQTAVPAFKSQIDAARIGGSYIIAVKFKSHNAEPAAQITNAIVDAYLNYQLQAKFEATHRVNQWLQSRLSDIAKESAAADQAVSDFMAKHNIVGTGTGKSQNELLLSDRNARLLQAQAMVTTAQARFDQIEGMINKNDALEDLNTFAAVTETLTNPNIVSLRTKYDELAAREANWSKRYGANHLAVVNLRTQMHEIRDTVFNELKQIAETYKSDLAIAKRQQEAVQQELKNAESLSSQDAQIRSTLADLESAAKSRHMLYDELQQRYMQSLPTESFVNSEARLVTAATVTNETTSPKPLLVLALAALGGLVIGCGVGLLRELFDRVFRTSEQVERALQTACIALVPVVENKAPPALLSDLTEQTSLAPERPRINPAKQTSILGPERPRVIVREPNIIWGVSKSPFSRFSEAIRSLKLAIDLARIDRPRSTVGVTSALPNEGKTTMAASLALHAAQVGRRTILVDADLRNPVLSRTLTPNASCGILEVISGKLSLEQVVWTDRSTNMVFLPAFVPFRFAQTSEILSNDRMAWLFEKLRESYDYVVIDLPPLAPIVDVRATKRIADMYLLVVQWGRTKIPLIERTLRDAPGVYENLLGVVLNKVDVDAARRYDMHLKAYYRNKHFSRYGYVDD